MLLLLALTGCTNTPFHISEISVRFSEHASSTATAGSGYLLVTEAEVACKAFKQGLEGGDLWRKVRGFDGVLLRMSYVIAGDTQGDAWIGYFAPGGTVPGGGDTGWGPGGDVRSASAAWFDEDGFWVNDSAGLLVEVGSYTSDEVEASFSHEWDSRSVTAENCGSFGG